MGDETTGPGDVAGAGPAALRAAAPSPLWTLSLFRSELVMTFRRWRTLALLG
ncbi:ABC transporter permease, partial [Streptomyces daliensis]|nr:ABC transporter permease [Streptomyces daliensis]